MDLRVFYQDGHSGLCELLIFATLREIQNLIQRKLLCLMLAFRTETHYNERVAAKYSVARVLSSTFH